MLCLVLVYHRIAEAGLHCAPEYALQLTPVNRMMYPRETKPSLGVERAEPRMSMAALRVQVRPLRNHCHEFSNELFEHDQAGPPGCRAGLEVLDACLVRMRSPCHQVGYDAKHVAIDDDEMFDDHERRPKPTAVLKSHQARHEHLPAADAVLERADQPTNAPGLTQESPAG